MTPVYDLNQPSASFPFVELIEDHQQLQLFLSPHHHHHAAYTSFSSSPSQDQLGSTQLIGQTTHQHDDHKVDKYMPDSRSRDHKQISSSSSLQVAIDDNMEVHKLSSLKREDENCYERSGNRSENWMSSKMRIMQNLMHSNCSEATNKPVKFTLKFQDHQHYQANNNDISSSYSNSNNNNIIRVCSDCNTTTTPLWRSGPRGPKSLCNACGIRQRKARRAMAAATAAGGNGPVVTVETPSTKTKIKEKKTRTSHVAQCKKLCKLPDHQPNNHGQKTKISFKNLALSLSKNSTLRRVFPQDVEEAAILLMELSCGFNHS